MKKLLTVPLVLFLLLVLSVAFNRYLFDQNRSLKAEVVELRKDPQQRAKDEAKSLASKLSSLVSLPEGEEPVIATVTDKDKLKDQAIFEKAENGDKLLIFANAKKAYLYDPKNNKLKDIIPVNLGDQGRVAGAETIANLKLALVNGSTTAGATFVLEKKLKDEKIPGVVAVKALAKKTDYQKTLVIDVEGKYKDQAASLAKALGVEVGNLPDGESKPTADLMVLIGADFK